MIRDLISSLHDRWANLHPLLRFLGVVAVLSLAGYATAKPAYRVFKQWRMDRNLVAARQAMEQDRMQEARDRSLTVLRSGDPSIEAFRILEKSTASLGDPRHGEIAGALISHPEGTDEDRLTGFLTVVGDMPLGLVGQAWNTLPEECQTQPRFATAFARRLLAGKRLGEAASVLLAVPEEARDDGVRLALARVLIASGRREGFEEAQRMIASGLLDGGEEVSAWLDVLEEVPAASLQESLLSPVRSLAEDPSGVDPARIALITARIDYAARWPQRATILNEAIATWQERSPEMLARFLSDLGLHQRLLDSYPAERIDSYPGLLPLLLDAAERCAAWDCAGQLLDASAGRLPKHLELAHRAVLAARTADANSRVEAWNAALAEAKTDVSNHALLALHRIATDASLHELASMAMVEAIRAGRGPLPLYEEQKSLCQALAAAGQDTTLLEICAIYLNFEPANPVLLTQYAYLACLNDVIEPAQLLPPLELLAQAFPKELPIHITLATAHLCGGQPEKAAGVLEPFELETKELSPAYRIVFLTSQVLSGKIPGNDPRIESFPWGALQASENRKFSALIRSAR
jgi:hypothetical protein